MYRPCDVCLGCGGSVPVAFLDLGATPLANSYIAAGQPIGIQPAYPLAVGFCTECLLVQLTGIVDPRDLFSEYPYFSSFSSMFLKHAENMAASLMERCGLASHSKVVEIASNDGYLLQYFQKLGIPCLGVEPATNVAEFAERCGIPTLNRFFDSSTVEVIRGLFGQADLIVGNNVLAHVPLINEFLTAVRSCLSPAGLAVFEFPYLGDLLTQREFDTIYHEHVFYFSLSAVDILARRARLVLVDAEHQSIHGGTMRVFLQRDTDAHSPTTRLKSMLLQENAEGLTEALRFKYFARDVKNICQELVELVADIRQSGQRIAAYGAPAKGNTLLNYCGLTHEEIEFTVDRNPHKQGRLMPGSGIPILEPKELARRHPDYALILPWNIANEIMDQQWEFTRKGGRFILPIPSPVIVEAPKQAGVAQVCH